MKWLFDHDNGDPLFNKVFVTSVVILVSTVIGIFAIWELIKLFGG